MKIAKNILNKKKFVIIIYATSIFICSCYSCLINFQNEKVKTILNMKQKK